MRLATLLYLGRGAISEEIREPIRRFRAARTSRAEGEHENTPCRVFGVELPSGRAGGGTDQQTGAQGVVF
jgi:hypothetical protein